MVRAYWAPVTLACYDNEGSDSGADDAGVGDGAGANAGANAGAGANDAKFNQEQLNKILADDRRKLEAKFKAEKKAELETKSAEYDKLSKHASLTSQERDDYKAKHEAAEAQLAEYLTEKENLLKQKKDIETALNGKLSITEKQAKEWQGRYEEASIKRELTDAAVKSDACSPQQMMALLRGQTRLVPIEGTDDYQVVVDLEDTENGVKVVKQLSPEAAMKRMKELPEHGNLFKANGVSGAGLNTAGTAGAGALDVKNMTQAQYRELRKKNPELLYRQLGVRK